MLTSFLEESGKAIKSVLFIEFDIKKTYYFLESKVFICIVKMIEYKNKNKKYIYQKEILIRYKILQLYIDIKKNEIINKRDNIIKRSKQI